MSRNFILLVIVALLLVVSVAADSDYCTPEIGTDTIINLDGTWANITIYSDACPICVQTVVGLECMPCPAPVCTTPTPCTDPYNEWCPLIITPCPTPAPCVGIWCPLIITPCPTPAPCVGIWCPEPTQESNQSACVSSPGVWCPV